MIKAILHRRRHRRFEKKYPNVVIMASILRDGYSFVAECNRIKPTGITTEQFAQMTSYEMAKTVHRILFSRYFQSLPETATYKLDRDIYPGLPPDHPYFTRVWRKWETREYARDILYHRNHQLTVDGFLPTWEESIDKINIHEHRI